MFCSPNPLGPTRSLRLLFPFGRYLAWIEVRHAAIFTTAAKFTKGDCMVAISIRCNNFRNAMSKRSTPAFDQEPFSASPITSLPEIQAKRHQQARAGTYLKNVDLPSTPGARVN